MIEMGMKIVIFDQYFALLRVVNGVASGVVNRVPPDHVKLVTLTARVSVQHANETHLTVSL